MEKTKFTPGPWIYVEGRGVMHHTQECVVQTSHTHGTASFSKFIARADHGHDFELDSENAENMRLISACPELLVALKKANEFVREVSRNVSQIELPEFVAENEALIARAEGNN
jgi:hypothetical protein